MSDIFEETEENLRTEQWMKIARFALPLVGGVVVALLLAAFVWWGWDGWRQSVAFKASEDYQAGLQANEDGDKVVAKAKFEVVVKDGNATYKALALQQLAALADLDHNTDEAVKDLDAAAAATNDPVVHDTAEIKAVYLLMDKSSFADIQKRLSPLLKDGRPASYLAREALAMAKLQNGDSKGARADLSALSLTLGTPEGVKQRAAFIVAAIDAGSAQTAIAAAKLPEPAAQMQMAPAMPGLEASPQDAQ